MLALAAGAALLTACGDGGSPDRSGQEPQAPPEASSFPEAGASLEDLLQNVGETNQIAVLPTGGVFTPGDDRLGFGIFDVGGAQITTAEAAVYATHGPKGEPMGPFPARVESLEVKSAYRAESREETDAKVVYVADVPFEKTGEYRLVALVRDSNGEVRAARMPSVVVDKYKDVPGVGEPAPSVHTPTIDDVGAANVGEIDTRVPPTTMHEQDLADVLGKRPVVLLFATPALCMSRVCGPVTDVTEQVKAEYGDEAAFIHMEIYEDNIPGEQNLREQMKAFGLFTEPWLFVIDRNGEVTTRIEGAFSAHELENALEPLIGA